MPSAIVAALALTAAAAPQGTPVESNLVYATPIAGDWSYAATPTGSQAVFANGTGNPQLTFRCTRATRRVAIVKAAPSASPSMWVWTSSQSRSLPATYDPAAGQVSTELGAYDAFLDAIAASRGRIGVSSSGLAALVVPPWADVARVIEDCRV